MDIEVITAPLDRYRALRAQFQAELDDDRALVIADAMDLVWAEMSNDERRIAADEAHDRKDAVFPGGRDVPNVEDREKEPEVELSEVVAQGGEPSVPGAVSPADAGGSV